MATEALSPMVHRLRYHDAVFGDGLTDLESDLIASDEIWKCHPFIEDVLDVPPEME
jgi:hypothetical protein